MSAKYLTSGYQRKSVMENFKWRSAPKMARRKAKETLKPLLNISTYRPSPGNRLHKIVQCDVALSERERMTMKPRESARLNRIAKGAKSNSKDPHQSRHLQTGLHLFATDSLVYS